MKKNKFLVCVFMIFILVAAVASTIRYGEYTDGDLATTIDKVKDIENDFENVAFSDAVEKTYSEHDVVLDEDIKVVVVRISSDYILQLKYNSQNKLIYSDVISEPTLLYGLLVMVEVFAIGALASITTMYGMEAYKEYQIAKEGQIVKNKFSNI